jgi:HIV Tat-specific factor 1
VGKPRPVTDVYVSNLPPRTTVDLLARIFGRAGLLMTDDEGNPKIKLYTDEAGTFKGDALVSYFKGESVDLAVTLFDDTELEMGSGEGNIHVSKAEYKQKPVREEKEDGRKQEGADGQRPAPADLGIGVAKQPAKKGKKPKEKTEEQKRAAKRIRNLQR